MSKDLTVILDDDGGIKTAFEGFKGDACHDEAVRLRASLADLGLDVELEALVPTDSGPRVPVSSKEKLRE